MRFLILGFLAVVIFGFFDCGIAMADASSTPRLVAIREKGNNMRLAMSDGSNIVRFMWVSDAPGGVSSSGYADSQYVLINLPSFPEYNIEAIVTGPQIDGSCSTPVYTGNLEADFACAISYAKENDIKINVYSSATDVTSTTTMDFDKVAQEKLNYVSMPLENGKPVFQTLGNNLSGSIESLGLSFINDGGSLQMKIDLEECKLDLYENCVVVASSEETVSGNSHFFDLPNYNLDDCLFYRFVIYPIESQWSINPIKLLGTREDSYKDGSYKNGIGVITEDILDIYFSTTGAVKAAPADRCFAPVIIIPGLLGSWMKNGSWVMDPVFHVYDNLIETFIKNGFVKERNLFTFPYDWRNSNVHSGRLLKEKIEEVKRITSYPKVNVIAHSMGGLVLRSYMQSEDFGHDIWNIILMGVPNEGSPLGYLAWEGGVAAPGILGDVTRLYMSYLAVKNKFKSAFDYIRGRPVSSIGELLPTYDYLRSAQTGELLHYPDGYPVNSFLEKINDSLSMAMISLETRIRNFTGRLGTSTVSVIRILSQASSTLWAHGYPENFSKSSTDRGLELGEGDGTVPETSNSIWYPEPINASHLDLPTATMNESFKELTKKTPAVIINESLPKRILFIGVLSPAHIMITSPSGEKIGTDPATGRELSEIEGAFYSGTSLDEELITIPDPLPGEYVLSTSAIGDGGEYTIMSSLVKDGESQEFVNSDTVFSGETRQMIFKIKEETMEVTPPLPKEEQKEPEELPSWSHPGGHRRTPEVTENLPVVVESVPILSESFEEPKEPEEPIIALDVVLDDFIKEYKKNVSAEKMTASVHFSMKNLETNALFHKIKAFLAHVIFVLRKNLPLFGT